MTKYDAAFRHRIVAQYLAGGAGVKALAKRHGIWLRNAQALDSCLPGAWQAGTMQEVFDLQRAIQASGAGVHVAQCVVVRAGQRCL